MKVLVIGKGGREHALVWKLAQSLRVERVFCAPGNAGTAEDGVNVPLEPTQFDELIRFAKKEGVGLTVVGPEDPLALGIVDAFQAEGLRIFGPSKEAAQLEASKAFSKQVMRHADVPTADEDLWNGGSTARASDRVFTGRRSMRRVDLADLARVRQRGRGVEPAPDRPENATEHPEVDRERAQEPEAVEHE